MKPPLFVIRLAGGSLIQRPNDSFVVSWLRYLDKYRCNSYLKFVRFLMVANVITCPVGAKDTLFYEALHSTLFCLKACTMQSSRLQQEFMSLNLAPTFGMSGSWFDLLGKSQ